MPKNQLKYSVYQVKSLKKLWTVSENKIISTQIKVEMSMNYEIDIIGFTFKAYSSNSI